MTRFPDDDLPVSSGANVSPLFQVNNSFSKPQTGLFLGLPIALVMRTEWLEWLTRPVRIKNGEDSPWPRTVGYLNAHMVNLAADDATQRERLNRFDLLYADGQSVVWAARFLGLEVPERLTAGDFLAPFCQRCVERGLRLFLIGGQAGVAEETARLWSEAAPGLQVVGTAHGFLNETQEAALIETIVHAAPDVILIGMGSPRQEIWVERWAAALAPARLWCVGALFEYSGQDRPRAPHWMRRLGLEWLFRLALEPARLWKRYLIGNPLFIGRVLCAAVKKCRTH
jgi:N-acetylglucosaminyldiphosphoundecaprenol N-acetyl-beta-D-mannosaminyltransferase